MTRVSKLIVVLINCMFNHAALGSRLYPLSKQCCSFIFMSSKLRIFALHIPILSQYFRATSSMYLTTKHLYYRLFILKQLQGKKKSKCLKPVVTKDHIWTSKLTQKTPMTDLFVGFVTRTPLLPLLPKLLNGHLWYCSRIFPWCPKGTISKEIALKHFTGSLEPQTRLNMFNSL